MHVLVSCDLYVYLVQIKLATLVNENNSNIIHHIFLKSLNRCIRGKFYLLHYKAINTTEHKLWIDRSHTVSGKNGAHCMLMSSWNHSAHSFRRQAQVRALLKALVHKEIKHTNKGILNVSAVAPAPDEMLWGWGEAWPSPAILKKGCLSQIVLYPEISKKGSDRVWLEVFK